MKKKASDEEEKVSDKQRSDIGSNAASSENDSGLKFQ
jgi:hypothetical protein